MSRGTVHLAGPSIVIDGRIIQRCLICGYKIVDSDSTVVRVNLEDGDPSIVWPIGGLVLVKTQSVELLQVTVTPVFRSENLPAHTCLDLIED